MFAGGETHVGARSTLNARAQGARRIDRGQGLEEGPEGVVLDMVLNVRSRGIAGSVGRIVFVAVIAVAGFGLICTGLAAPSVADARSATAAQAGHGVQAGGPDPADRVILFVLEGVGPDAPKAGPMPVLSRFVTEGSVTWSALSPTPARRLPSMASIITGLPVEKHGITWDRFDFARGYPRPASLFDYLDLSGGKDTAIFFMDESLYQLARPEPYIDYQMCGPLRPECNSDQVVKYVRDYLVKGASGEGYGRRIVALPDLLLVHLPEAGWVGQASGWSSTEYHQALQTVDRALGSILDTYRELKLLDRTTVFVTGLNTGGSSPLGDNGEKASQVPWIAWGFGIKAGHVIEQPVSLLDTGATVMRTLGVETYTEWESRPIEEVFTTPSAIKTESTGKGRH